jgi:hypothetical protein
MVIKFSPHFVGGRVTCRLGSGGIEIVVGFSLIQSCGKNGNPSALWEA